jgi:hypothetical protein
MGVTLPYDMFDLPRSADEARRFAKVKSIYHRGQSLVWDGQAVLEELWTKHGGSGLLPSQQAAAQRVLGTIMWGELAAWKIAARLADELEALEPRMAATSQAHDEARHFYVMHDYLKRATGDFPRSMSKESEALIGAALNANTIPKMLIGMQLQIEATALTIFHALREVNVCPVLTDLLTYYEKDEARHVGLGVQLLPALMRRMQPAETVAFTAFSFKVVWRSILALKGMEGDLRTLGVDPRRVAVLGKSKQLLVFEELWKLLPGPRPRVNQYVSNAMEAVADAFWPEPAADTSVMGRARRMLSTFKDGIEPVATVLDPSGEERAPVSWKRPAASAGLN